MRFRLLLSIFLLSFCGGDSDAAVTTEETTVTTQQVTTTTTPTIQEETTTTIQEETNTTIQEETNTTSTTILDAAHSQCKKGDQSEECLAQHKEFCEENPDSDQCVDYDSENMSDGGEHGSGGSMPSGGSSSGSDDPPTLKNLLIMNWGPYDSSTAVSGDFEFTTVWSSFDEFGRVHSAGTPSAYDNPTFEYKVPLDTKVYIPIDGVVDFVNWQPSSGYKQDDWELTIKPRQGSDWVIVIDHVVNISCDRTAGIICDDPLTVNGVQLASGTQVTAGDLLGYVGNFEDGGGNHIGRTEITVGKYVWGSGGSGGGNKDFNNYCPMNYLHESVKSELEASVTQLMASYESWKGDSTFYDEANMVAPGCWYTEIYEDGNTGKTTPTK